MNRSISKGGMLFATITTIFALNYSTSVLAAGLFDDLLENAVESIAKEVINDLNKNKQDAPKKATEPAPSSSNQPINTRVKSTISKPTFKRPTKENHQWQAYKDWDASVDTVQDSDGGWTTSCAIHTGGDGIDSISATISWGNGDPGTSPTVDYQEVTYRNMQTNLQGKQQVTWVVKTSKGSFRYPGETYTGHDESGHPYAINRIQGNMHDSDSLNLLRAFAKGSTVTLFDEYSGGDIHTASLSGFSASYRKVSQWCGFSPDSVLSVAPEASKRASTESTSDTAASTEKVYSMENKRPNQAKDLWEKYQDWQATVQTYDTEDGDWVTNCAIRTGGDGSDSITIEAAWGDVLPPEAPLNMSYTEATARGYATQLKEDDKVHWQINSANKRSRFSSSHTYAGINENGIPYSSNNITGNEDILYALAKGEKLVLRAASSNKELYTASLIGFPDAYQRLSQWCGFSPDNVLR